MQLRGAFQSHVLRLCAFQILVEALVCKSNECLGKVGLWLINIEKFEIPTDHAGNRNLRAPQAKHTKYGAQISDKHLSVLNYENRSVRPALQNMLDPPRFGHQWLVAPPISWPWTMTRLIRSVSQMHLHIFDICSSSWPMSVSGPSHVFAPSLRTSCNFCSRLPMGDTSPQTARCLADATLPEARLSWAKRVSLVKESTKRWHLPSHAEHELCKVCICTSHLELVGLKKCLPTTFKHDIWYKLKRSYRSKILALSM